MKKQRTALFIIYIRPHFTEFVQLGRFLKNESSYEPIFLFHKHYGEAQFERDQKLCEKEGFAVIDWVSDPYLHKGKGNISYPFPLNHIVNFVKRVQFFCTLHSILCLFLSSRRTYEELKKEIALVLQLLTKYKPDIIVLSEDNVGYETGIVTRAAKNLGIPTAIIPFTIANAKEPAAAMESKSPTKADIVLGKLISVFYPSWAMVCGKKKRLRLSAGRVLAMEWTGISPPLPWILNSGHSTAILMESEFMRDYYREAGIPEKKMKITGSVMNDILYRINKEKEKRRQELNDEMGFAGDRMLVLCALPPSQFPRPNCIFKKYDEVVGFWIDTLNSARAANVVFSVHPRITAKEIAWIESLGAKVSKRSVIELIPLADIYVASISATIRWAIAAGKPVLNYDVYRYRYDDYKDAPGILTTEDSEEFKEKYKRLTEDRQFYETLRRKQQSVMHRWGMLDGKGGARIIKIFDKLISVKK